MSAEEAWQEWADAELEFGALGSFALEVKPAFTAGYRRALEDAADEWTTASVPTNLRQWLRARAAAAAPDPRETEN